MRTSSGRSDRAAAPSTRHPKATSDRGRWAAAPIRLKRQFTVDGPNKAWVPDFTCTRTCQSRLHLAVVMDLYARRIVGWCMKPSLARGLVLDAILMAVWRRRPSAGLISHSDQGSQYGSDDFQRFCRTHRLEPRMSRRANCWQRGGGVVFQQLEEVNESESGSIVPATRRRRICSITSRCSTIVPGATTISVASAPKPSSRLHAPAPSCPRYRGRSTSKRSLSTKLSGVSPLRDIQGRTLDPLQCPFSGRSRHRKADLTTQPPMATNAQSFISWREGEFQPSRDNVSSAAWGGVSVVNGSGNGEARIAIRIPHEHTPGFMALAELSDEETDLVVDYLANAPPSASVDLIASPLADQLTRDLSTVASFLRVALALAAEMRRTGLAKEAFLRAFSPAIRQEVDRLGMDGVTVVDRIDRILKSGRALPVTAKAIELLDIQPRPLRAARVLTDIRPLFSSDESPSVEGGLIVHTLALTCAGSESDTELYVALDEVDLLELRRLLDRAERKASSLRKMFDDTGLSLLATRTEGE